MRDVTLDRGGTSLQVGALALLAVVRTGTVQCVKSALLKRY